MLKKAIILASALALLLASTQLALAQQDAQPTQVQATHQDISGMQQGTGGSSTAGDTQAPPAGASQAAALDPSPQNMIPDAPPVGPDRRGALMHLNKDNELVVDCQALSDRLASLQQAGETADPQAQSQLALAESLLQLCEANGFTPSGSGGTAPVGQDDTAGSTQPQQGGGTPPSPTDTSSTQSHQNEESHIVG
jgi:hypothetical protein